MEKKFDISYLGENIIVNVLNKDWEIEDFYEELGDIDIVECNEIAYSGESILVDSARDVFEVPNSVFYKLRNEGRDVILKVSSLVDYVDLDKPETRRFLAWYFATTTGHRDEIKEQDDAIKIMFEQAGWDCTDPDNLQFRLEIEADEEYRFCQRTLFPDKSQQWVFDEYKYSEIEHVELMEACKNFGYTHQQIDRWICEGEEIPLMLECLFETQN